MNSPISDKIKKLLALATKNTNQAEMEAAMEKAIELATAHGIDLAKLELAGQQSVRKDYVLSNMEFGGRLPVVSIYITNILANHFRVRSVLTGSRDSGRGISMVGTETDVDMGKFVFSFLSERFMSLWHEYHRRTGCGVGSRESFFLGMYNGLNNKLAAAKAKAEATITNDAAVNNQYCIVVRNEKQNLDLAVNKFFNKLSKTGGKKRVVGDGAAYQRGQETGEKININRPIGY